MKVGGEDDQIDVGFGRGLIARMRPDESDPDDLVVPCSPIGYCRQQLVGHESNGIHNSHRAPGPDKSQEPRTASIPHAGLTGATFLVDGVTHDRCVVRLWIVKIDATEGWE